MIEELQYQNRDIVYRYGLLLADLAELLLNQPTKGTNK